MVSLAHPRVGRAGASRLFQLLEFLPAFLSSGPSSVSEAITPASAPVVVSPPLTPPPASPSEAPGDDLGPPGTLPARGPSLIPSAVLSATQGNSLMGLGILGGQDGAVDAGRVSCGPEGSDQRGCLYWVPESFTLSSANGPG